MPSPARRRTAAIWSSWHLRRLTAAVLALAGLTIDAYVTTIDDYTTSPSSIYAASASPAWSRI